MISVQALSEIDELQKEHCSNCIAYKRIIEEANHFRATDFCLKNCWVTKKMQKIAAITAKKEKQFTKGERYYLLHHIDVLGRERGVKQVASRLEAKEYDVEWTYDEIKRKTRQLAG